MADRLRDAAVRLLPLGGWGALRHGAVRLRRGGLARGACVAGLKVGMRAWRGRLAGQLDAIRPLDAPELSFAPTDSMVMDAVHWLGLGGYEGQLPGLWARLCRESRSVLEIGGNVGLFTVVGARVRAGGYTVLEPLAEVMEALRTNLAWNGIEGVETRVAAAIPQAEAAAVSFSVAAEGRAAPVGSHLVEGIGIAARGAARVITVEGLPFASLVAGRDLVKIDAEGIEAALLGSAEAEIVERRPTLLVEVLPEARELGELLARLARRAGYGIHVVPEYGDPRIETVAPDRFGSDVPQRFRSKDVVLRVGALPG